MSQEELSREQMITLVRKIVRAEGTEAEQAAGLALFQTNCMRPDGIMIFRHDPAKPEPTAEEIVDKAMSPAFRTWLEPLHTFDPERGAAPLRVPLPTAVSQAASEQFAAGGFRFCRDHPHYGST